MKVLLEHGVNKDAQNKKGLVPIHITVGKADVSCTKLLLSYGASVNIKVCLNEKIIGAGGGGGSI